MASDLTSDSLRADALDVGTRGYEFSFAAGLVYVGDQVRRLVEQRESAPFMPADQVRSFAGLFPHKDGDTLVLGPEVFVSQDRDVICWRGENYYRPLALPGPEAWREVKVLAIVASHVVLQIAGDENVSILEAGGTLEVPGLTVTEVLDDLPLSRDEAERRVEATLQRRALVEPYPVLARRIVAALFPVSS